MLENGPCCTLRQWALHADRYCDLYTPIKEHQWSPKGACALPCMGVTRALPSQEQIYSGMPMCHTCRAHVYTLTRHRNRRNFVARSKACALYAINSSVGVSDVHLPQWRLVNSYFANVCEGKHMGTYLLYILTERRYFVAHGKAYAWQATRALMGLLKSARLNKVS